MNTPSTPRPQSRLWVFNPGHEEALQHRDKASYTPSRLVRRMMHELPLLLRPLCQAEDYIYAPSLDGLSALVLDSEGRVVEDYSRLPELALSLWALDPHTLRRIERWANTQGIRLKLPNISEAYYQLSDRSSASDFLLYLTNHCPSLLPSMDLIPQWLPKEDKVRQSYTESLSASGYTRLALKHPYSSSGRGVELLRLPLNETDSTRLERYERISLEPGLDKLQDYALLYYMDAKGISTIGYSKFLTAPNRETTYAGNILAPQTEIAEELSLVLGSREALEQLHRLQSAFLWQELGGQYQGYIGIDVMSYRDNDGALQLHPCIEINVRCTMGVLALYLSEKPETPTYGIYRLNYPKAPTEPVLFITPSGEGPRFVAFIEYPQYTQQTQ
ncbi:MAG: hypothetical protein SOW66_07460 [Porphyromonas sp.]|nr:hypothetical protein [Porphyromonas sp.]